MSPTRTQVRMLGLLNLLAAQGRYEMYRRPHSRVVNRRRAANKAARISRRLNRG